jgi:UDP-glucose 4-epimerase
VLVTGGAGFIGSHLVDGLIAAGQEVAALDNLSTGRRHLVNSRARLFEIDLRDAPAVGRALGQFAPEVVAHLAAQSEVPKSIADPMFDAEVNILGGLNLLASARSAGTRKIIFASTGGALYGDPETVPCDETHPIRPLSPYGASKAAFETYLGIYRRIYGLEYTIVRYANVYGPRQDGAAEEGRVVATFAARMIAGQPVVIDGDGNQARDLVYISDVIAATVASLNRADGVTCNIGTGVPTTVNEVFERLRRITGYGGPGDHGPARKGDVYSIALQSDRARRELGWEPVVDLDTGLRKTVEYFRELPAQSAAS